MHDFSSELAIVNTARHQQQVDLHRLTRTQQNAVSEHYDIVWCSLFEKKKNQCVLHSV